MRENVDTTVVAEEDIEEDFPDVQLEELIDDIQNMQLDDSSHITPINNNNNNNNNLTQINFPQHQNNQTPFRNF
jgi:hypothetical protein